MDVRLYKVGSDPEFLFVSPKGLVPAPTVVNSHGGDRATTAFIGTDGHAVTGELRPRPYHHIHGHMWDIAFAINKIREVLDKTPEQRVLNMIAVPWAFQEPLGGHIHMSGWARNTYSAEMHDRGLYIKPNGSIDRHGHDTAHGGVTPGDISRFTTMISADLPYTPRQFAFVMAYLLGGLESYSQPWEGREARNLRYGNIEDQVRVQQISKPGTAKTVRPGIDWVYFHYEYRTPSTWLYHPALAYLYFAFAKITMLNYDVMKQQMTQLIKEPEALTATSIVDNFRKRCRWLKTRHNTGEVLISKDCAEWERAVKSFDDVRAEYVAPVVKNHYPVVNVEAWRKLL